MNKRQTCECVFVCDVFTLVGGRAQGLEGKRCKREDVLQEDEPGQRGKIDDCE